MIKGAGGTRTLARHRELEIVATKSYDNQGVTAAYTVRARAPASREETETWSARGKWIGASASILMVRKADRKRHSARCHQ